MVDHRPHPKPKPFDLAHSLRLDAIVIQLDTRPAWPRRAVLRTQKRLAERRVPAYLPKAGVR